MYGQFTYYMSTRPVVMEEKEWDEDRNKNTCMCDTKKTSIEDNLCNIEN